MTDRRPSQTPTVVRSVSRDAVLSRSDVLATEEPLEIRVQAGGERRTVAVTMRTPGSDFELATGFLYGEGVVSGLSGVRSVRYCTDPDVDTKQQFNVVTVDLTSSSLPDLGSLERHFYTTSACGVCGKASLEAVRSLGGPALGDGPVLGAEALYGMPDRVREGQRVFSRTGGLHASALFDAAGDLVALREDVGRHNAMDKLVGWSVLEERVPLTDHVALLSGRASFELLQKALRAGIAFVCAIGAPSSLAVDVARSFGMTLVGFLRPDGFNVYAGEERVLA